MPAKITKLSVRTAKSRAADVITVKDLEVFYCVGVPDDERAAPQRLWVTIEMRLDFQRAAAKDDLTKTINYYEVSQRLNGFGERRSWKLIETLASDIATAVLEEFKPTSVVVEVKKFILPNAKYVSVRIARP